jgi:hypothetical protein
MKLKVVIDYQQKYVTINFIFNPPMPTLYQHSILSGLIDTKTEAEAETETESISISVSMAESCMPSSNV